MDWDYYIDNDLSNAIVRAGIFWLGFRTWYKHIVSTLINNRRRQGQRSPW